MDFWNTEITAKSWGVLQELTARPIRFILIGGWAAYLWTRHHKSKDVDIIITRYEDLEYLKTHFGLKKNSRLRKYEIVLDDIDVDIYVPFYSRLPLPAEELQQYATTIEGIAVVKPEALLILKQVAEEERAHSVKGEKDRIDIMALLCFAPVDFPLYLGLIEKHHLGRLYERLRKIIIGFDGTKYLGLNPRELKKKKEALLRMMKET